MIWIRNAQDLKELTTILQWDFTANLARENNAVDSSLNQENILDQSITRARQGNNDQYDAISISIPEVYQILECPRGQNPARSWSGGLQIWTKKGSYIMRQNKTKR